MLFEPLCLDALIGFVLGIILEMRGSAWEFPQICFIEKKLYIKRLGDIIKIMIIKDYIIMIMFNRVTRRSIIISHEM